VAHSQELATHAVGDVTDQVRRSAARPTLIVRYPKRSRLPLVVAFVAVAGAAVGVWLAIGREGGSSSAGTTRSHEATGADAPAAANGEQGAKSAPVNAKTEAAPTKTGPSSGTAQPVARPDDPATTTSAGNEPATTKSAGSEPGASPVAEPAGSAEAPAGAKTGEPAAAAAAGDRSSSPMVTADPPAEVKADSKKKPAKVVGQDARTKGAKPKLRAEPKRVDSKRQKTDAKEPQWDNDSPFLPTPQKR
jgi:hypothetical protein